MARISILGTGEIVKFAQKEDRIFLEGLPEQPPDDLMPVLRIELEGNPESVSNPYSGYQESYE